jgi:hypothetical protein
MPCHLGNSVLGLPDRYRGFSVLIFRKLFYIDKVMSCMRMYTNNSVGKMVFMTCQETQKPIRRRCHALTRLSQSDSYLQFCTQKNSLDMLRKEKHVPHHISCKDKPVSLNYRIAQTLFWIYIKNANQPGFLTVRKSRK